MGKIAFVFSGQGAQYPGMGKEMVHVNMIRKINMDVRAVSVSNYLTEDELC